MVRHWCSPYGDKMATIDDLVKSGKSFLFRGGKYKFHSITFEPTIEMINEDGEIFSFGVGGRIKDDFVLVPDGEESL